MSTVVDQRVAELRFDNAHFEKNVSQSLSTLDKLKQKLNITGASKGLEDVGKAAKNVNMDHLGRSAETVGLKFNAMYTMADQALRNITNRVQHAAENVVKSLTIAPISAGWSEYELKMGSVQTIMASTGESLETVNEYLNKLNEYSDQTIYSFSDMTQNIGKFTNAGVKLEDAVAAIKGISNEAALSGANANEASRAMYNFAQALSAGYVKLIDWKSIENANMATVGFKEELINTAVEMGTLTKTTDGFTTAEGKVITATQNFNDSLQDQWMTSDVLISTLKKYSDTETEIGKKATQAATEVKTFSQMMDTLKESAQSGWAQTWEIIFGDFEQGKALWTGINNFLGGLIDKMSEWRNTVLKIALGDRFSDIGEKIKSIFDPVNKTAGAIKGIVDTLKDYDTIVNEIIGGQWGNGQSRWDALTEAGYDWAHAQNLVNKKLGDSTIHATDYAEAQEDVAEATDKLTAADAKSIEHLVSLTDAQLKAKNLNDEQIAALRELEDLSNKLGIPIRELVENMDQLNGRWILLNSFKNIGQSLIQVFNAMKTAWQDIFPPKTSEEYGNMLFDLIAKFHKFTRSLVMNDETVGKLERTFKGVFSALDLVLTVVGGPIKIAFKLLNQLLAAFDLNVLDVTAAIGDAIYNFNEWVESSLDFTEVFEKLVPYVQSGVTTIQEWLSSFKNSEIIKSAVKYLSEFTTKIKEAFTAVRNGDFDIAKDIVDGLVKGLASGAKRVWNAALEIGISVLKSICDFLGIKSPSRKFIEVGGYIIDGLVQGLQNGFSTVWNLLKSFGQKCVEVVSNIDFSKIFAMVASGALIMIIKKIGDAIDAFSGPLEGISDILENTADAIKAFKGTLKAFSANIKAKAIKNIAIALAILVGSIIALTFIDPSELWNAVGVVAALAVVLGVLSVAADKMAKSSITIGKDGLKKAGFNAGIISIGISLLLLAATVKMIGNLNTEQAKQGFLGLAGLVVAVGIVFAAYGKLVSDEASKNIGEAGKMMLKLSAALLIMAVVAKMIAKMTWADMGKAAAGIGGFVVIIALLTLITKIAGNKLLGDIGDTILKIAGAIAILTIVAKSIAKMSWSDMGKAAAGMLGMVGIIALLTLITKMAGKNIDKLGATLLAISGSMLILVFVAKLIAGMEWGEMGKAAIGLLGLAGVIAVLVGIVKSVEKDAPKIAGTLLAISVAIGILAGVAIILSLIDIPGLIKGVTAMSLLGLVMAAMIASTRGAKDVKGSIMAMAIAIGVIAAAATILTLIDSKKLLVSTAALSAMMLSFAQIAKHAGGLKGSLGSLIVMTVAVGLMAGLVYVLAKLPVESVLGTSISLSALIISLAASFKLISGPSFVNPMTLVAIGVMTLVMAALGGILYLLKDLPVESTITNTIALSTLLLALSGACVILGVAGTLGPAAFIGVGALVTLVAALGGLIIGIGALADKFPKMEEFLNKGIPILEKIGHGLGSFFGNIISGFAEGLTDGLPGIADNLSNFMIKLQPFIDGAKAIDETALNGISSLVKMVAMVSGANIIETISSFITGGSSMDTFAVQLVKFGDAIVAFSNKVKGNIDESSILAAANAGKMLAEMQSMTAGTGGVVQWFCGEKNLETFGTQLLAFGDAIVGFSKKVAGNIDEAAVTAAASAGTVMAELQSKVAPAGGVVQWFTGEKDMTIFGQQLTAFGEAIVGFSNKVKEGINEEAVKAASTAGSIMTELQSKIIPTGGVIQWFTGEKNLQTFGTQLAAFGEAIVGFSQKVAGNIDEGAVVAASNAGKMMVELQKSIPEDKWFDGKVSLDDFGKSIKKFGGHIKSYSEKVSGINTEAINASVAATKQIVSIIRSLGSVNPDNIDNFKAKTLGKAIKSYGDNVSGLNSGAVSNSIYSINKLIGVIANMSGLDTSGVFNFKKAIDSLSKTNIDSITKSFSNSASRLSNIGSNIIDSIAKGMRSRQGSINSVIYNIIMTLQRHIISKITLFQQAGVMLMTRFANGINSGRSRTVSAIRTPLTAAVSTIRSYYTSFYSAGSYLVSGFASGISANTWRAEARAKAMANAAEKAAKKALDINSPSKVFRALGYSVPEGFAMGIDRLSYMATGSASDMANTAIGGVKDAIARISDYMNSDIDSQPTIRPVVDLSDVKSGASAINGMFNSAQTVGVMSNIRSISSSMNQRNQNGTNADVVSELSKLRSELGNIGGNSYNINGITYNDDSPIADAMKAIVRATIREGRV